MADLRARVIVEGEDRASGPLGRLSSFLSDRFVITLGDVTRGLRAVFDGLGSLIRASAEEEAAVNGLRAALAPLGAEAERVTRALTDQATALQNTTAFSDDAIIAGQRLAATFTQSEAQLKAITQAAVDLAASGRIDLQSAFTLLGRASTGATETLGRYGIKVTEGASATQKFAEALTQINQQVGGQAIAQVDTFAGSIAQMRNAFSESLQVLGDAVIKNQQVRDSIQQVTDLLRSPEFAAGLAGFVNGIVTAVSTAATAFNTLVNNIAGASLVLGAFFADVAKLDLSFSNTAATAKRVATELNNVAAGTKAAGDASAKHAADIDKARLAQEKAIAAARNALDSEKLLADFRKQTAALAEEQIAAQAAYAASLDDVAESADGAASALSRMQAAGEAQSEQAAAAAAEEQFSIVGGIKEVSRRARTAADTPAALLRANIESLRRGGFTQPGQILRLQRRLAQLEAADLGGVDDSRSIA